MRNTHRTRQTGSVEENYKGWGGAMGSNYLIVDTETSLCHNSSIGINAEHQKQMSLIGETLIQDQLGPKHQFAKLIHRGKLP